MKVLCIYQESSWEIRFTRLASETGRKLNVHQILGGHPGPLLNALCTFNLKPVYILGKIRNDIDDNQRL